MSVKCMSHFNNPKYQTSFKVHLFNVFSSNQSLFGKLPKRKHLVRHIYTNLAPWQNDQTFSYGTQEFAKGGNSEFNLLSPAT